MRWYKRLPYIIIYSLFLMINIAPKQALGLPAPMSQSDLINNSDLFAKVHVLKVDKATNTALAEYEIAGTVASNRVIHEDNSAIIDQDSHKKLIKLCWPELPKDLLGPWRVEFQENEEVNVYLRWIGNKNSQDKPMWNLYNNLENCYAATWWNAKIIHTSDNLEEKLDICTNPELSLKTAPNLTSDQIEAELSYAVIGDVHYN